MNCPKCAHALRQICYESVIVETCDGCGGEWLDKGEIARINKAREIAFSDNAKAQVDGAKKVVLGEVSKTQKTISCPHCHVAMRTLNYAYDSGVMIDKCPSCEGIWLDSNELEAIQIVIEEWEKRDGDIRARFSPVLANIHRQTSANMGQSATPGTKGVLAKAIVYNLF